MASFNYTLSCSIQEDIDFGYNSTGFDNYTSKDEVQTEVEFVGIATAVSVVIILIVDALLSLEVRFSFLCLWMFRYVRIHKSRLQFRIFDLWKKTRVGTGHE